MSSIRNAVMTGWYCICEEFLGRGIFWREGGGPNMSESPGKVRAIQILGYVALVFWTWDASITPNQSNQMLIGGVN